MEGGIFCKSRCEAASLFESRHDCTEQKNIAAHYDLGNDFFSLFLDPTMSYSGGVFVNPEDSMEQASINKFDAICRKLDLKPSDEVIEIGTGWGGFAIMRPNTTAVMSRQPRLVRSSLRMQMRKLLGGV